MPYFAVGMERQGSAPHRDDVTICGERLTAGDESLATKALNLVPEELLLFVACRALSTGKSVENVRPATYALPAESTPIPAPYSIPLPPR
jgi:hypothetical protein